jgi:5-methyltetrahydropteroyltriglutamate--homocysteine methyltransferase
MELLRCLPNKKIHVGVIDLRDLTPETPEIVAGRLRAALDHIPVERIVVAPDCGMKYLPRDVAYAKLVSMVEGARIVRRELE